MFSIHCGAAMATTGRHIAPPLCVNHTCSWSHWNKSNLTHFCSAALFVSSCTSGELQLCLCLLITGPPQSPAEPSPGYLQRLVIPCLSGPAVFEPHTWLMSLVHAAFSCRDGASKTTVKAGESDGSTTSLKSS